MRVMLLTASYPPVLGGLQTVCGKLAQQLLLRGNEVQVITNRYPRNLPATGYEDGVKITRQLFMWPSIDMLRRGRLDLFAAALYTGPGSALSLQMSARAMRPDVINLHFPDGLTSAVLRLHSNLQEKLIVSLHGDDVLEWSRLVQNNMGLSTAERRRLNQFVELLGRASAVTACSQYLLDKAIELVPGISTKGFVIHNGIDIERFADRSRYVYQKEYIYALGRLSHQKGFDLLIKAFAKIAHERDYLDLIISGTGEEQAKLITLVEELDLVDRVHFFGRATSQEVVRFLNGCCLAVVSSRWEPFGIVALEVLAAGKPLVTTRVGGIPEFVDEASAGIRLVEPDAESIAGGIRSLLNVSLDASIEKHHRQIAVQYSWDTMVDKYIEAYRYGIT